MMIDEDNLKRIFSTNLKFFMHEKEISESAISHETGISQSAINRIKNGVVCPTLYQAIIIGNYFKLDIEQFLIDRNENKNSDKYIPIINSDDFIKNGKKNVQGFYEFDESMPNSIGFKYGSTFACSVLNKETIVIVRKLTKHIPNGSTLLFIDKMKYKIGNYQNGHIKPIDDLLTSYDINKIQIIGSIVKIETNYIREKALINKIKETIGSKKLSDLLETSLSFSFS